MLNKPGLLVAEATLEANGIQDLADQIPEIAKAGVGHELKFYVRLELGGDTAPDANTVQRIDSLLSQVSESMKLR